MDLDWLEVTQVGHDLQAVNWVDPGGQAVVVGVGQTWVEAHHLGLWVVIRQKVNPD